MPHKRAKRSTREQLRQERGYNLAPERQSLSDEVIPKSVARVINAMKIREQWKLKRLEPEIREDRGDLKRKKIHHRQEDGGNTTPSSQLRIRSGESIQHFNRRVEDNMGQPVLRPTIQTARTVIGRDVKRETKNRQNPKSSMPSSPVIDRSVSRRKVGASANHDRTSERFSAPSKDFAKFSAAVPKRLNDVAQAPPTLTALPRHAKRQRQEGTHASAGDALETSAQSEKERDAVIWRYRLLKERRRKLSVAESVEDELLEARQSYGRRLSERTQ